MKKEHLKEVQLRDSRYLSEVFKLRCAGDLLGLGLFPNAKEITESAAVFHAATSPNMPFKMADKDVRVVVVGDGGTPRTGAYFALRTAWQVYSIDPALGHKECWNRIKRLTIIRERIEDTSGFFFPKAILVLPHSHASLHVCLRKVNATRLSVVSLPCCVRHEIAGLPPDIEYDDMGVWSPMRRVKIWTNVPLEVQEAQPTISNKKGGLVKCDACGGVATRRTNYGPRCETCIKKGIGYVSRR